MTQEKNPTLDLTGWAESGVNSPGLGSQPLAQTQGLREPDEPLGAAVSWESLWTASTFRAGRPGPSQATAAQRLPGPWLSDGGGQ